MSKRQTCFRALDFSFDVTSATNDQRLNERATDVLGDLAADVPAHHHYSLTQAPADPRNRILLARDGEPVGYPMDGPEALSRLMSDITVQAVASRPGHLALHAAAVSLGGHGLVLPAVPSAGKSTLAAALVAAGFDYLSDEAAVIEVETTLIAPFRKPLSLHRDSLELLGRTVEGADPADDPVLVPASALAPLAPARPAPARTLVFPNYQPGAVSTLVPITRAEAVVELANNAFNFTKDRMAVLRRLVSPCTCARLITGDLDAACDLLLALVSSTEGAVG